MLVHSASRFMQRVCKNPNYRILQNTRASPNRRAPKFLDHLPEVSSSKIYMTTLFNDRLNAVLTICLLHSMK